MAQKLDSGIPCDIHPVRLGHPMSNVPNLQLPSGHGGLWVVRPFDQLAIHEVTHREMGKRKIMQHPAPSKVINDIEVYNNYLLGYTGDEIL